jgi:hypothetical protein
LEKGLKMPDVIPSGIFAGIAIGLLACLYWLRGDEPDWWKNFDPHRTRYQDETFSMRGISRACLGKKELVAIRHVTFRKCKFVGPDVAVFIGGLHANGNRWIDPGTAIIIPDQTMVTGMVVFQDCTFEGCEFDKVQLLMSKEIHALFTSSVKMQENLNQTNDGMR